MNRSLCVVACLAGVVVSACGGPAVVADSRGPFDTVSGLYGGNEFSPLSAEGKRTFAGDPPEKAAAVPVAAPAHAPAAAVAPVAVTAPAAVQAPAPAAPVLLATGTASGTARAAAPAPIPIDPNAFGAVFSAATGAVKPTAEQLMQLDSLSLITAEPLRSELQKKLLACRRAGDSCRLAAN
jgi:hypothetical protein